MIAEDSDASRRFIREILEIANHEVVAEASDGIEAVERFIATKPDLVLLDLAMPKKDGLQTIKEILTTDKTAKIILLSASGNLRTLNECVQAGAVCYVMKPFAFDELLGIIRTTLSS
jgi:two-component system chemotaxis response regulator CheY